MKTCRDCGSHISSHWYRQDGVLVVQFFCGARAEKGFSEVTAKLVKKCSEERTRDAVDAFAMSVQNLPGLMSTEDIRKEARAAMFRHQAKVIAWDSHQPRLSGVDLGKGSDRTCIAYVSMKVKAEHPKDKNWTQEERMKALMRRADDWTVWSGERIKLRKRITKRFEYFDKLEKENAELKARLRKIEYEESMKKRIAGELKTYEGALDKDTLETIRLEWNKAREEKKTSAMRNAPIGSRLSKMLKGLLGK